MIVGTPEMKSQSIFIVDNVILRKGVCMMAYYSTPYNYNFGYYPQLMQQPMVPVQQPVIYPQQQVVEQPQQNLNVQSGQTTSDSYFIWVQGEAGAKSYPVARGTTVPLFDSEGDYVYFKSVDNNGVPLPLVTKVISDPPVDVTETKSDEIVTPQVDMSDYVTKKSYDELVKKCSDLEMRLLELETKPSSSFTSNFTGSTFNNSRKGKEDGNKFTV